MLPAHPYAITGAVAPLWVGLAERTVIARSDATVGKVDVDGTGSCVVETFNTYCGPMLFAPIAAEVLAPSPAETSAKMDS